jgi:hypothetical protein
MNFILNATPAGSNIGTRYTCEVKANHDHPSACGGVPSLLRRGLRGGSVCEILIFSIVNGLLFFAAFFDCTKRPHPPNRRRASRQEV